MLSVAEALKHVAARACARPPVAVAAGEALGLVLAEDVTSDVDSPPFDKTLVDGYAVVAADLAGGTARLAVLEEVTAGAVPSRVVGRGQATRLMTGAPLPAGSDAVVMIEASRLCPASASGDGLGMVEITSPGLIAGANILRRGAAMRQGQVVLAAGSEVRPIEVGLLAEVGAVQVQVFPRPRVAVLATGNELVPPGCRPAPGQIRNSNGPMLSAAVARAGGVPLELGVARDEPAELKRRVSEGLQADVLLLSGGVSAGVLDLVPGVLAELGVEQVFHKVHFKPGKPLWFGVLAGPAGEKLVFGLPGNPVSSLVCFELFVRPTLAALSGRGFRGLNAVRARLAHEHAQRGDRPTYHPAVLNDADGQPLVRPLPWQGSADLAGLAAANALAYFPAGNRLYAAGAEIEAFYL